MGAFSGKSNKIGDLHASIPVAVWRNGGCMFSSSAFGTRCRQSDPKHYSVVTENDQVRVLKVHYDPHEKSVMHSHPAAVAVFMTDASVQFSYPDGKKDSRTVKAGDSQFTPAGVHLPENMGDKAMEVTLIELKGKAAKANSMEKK